MNSQGGAAANDSPNWRLARFGIFEFDQNRNKLSRKGSPIKLQQQPAMLLAYLIRRSGLLVTRDELRTAIWPTGTYVEFDFSLNSAISRLRRVLGDSATEPRFIETIPKQGYRFIAPIELVFPSPEEAVVGPQPVEETEVDEARPATRKSILIYAAGGLVVLLAAIALYRWKPTATVDGRLLRYTISLPPEHAVSAIAISPQGDQIAYTAQVRGQRQLYRRFLDEEESRQVAGSEGAEIPFFSPDGKQLGFYSPTSLRIAGPSGNRDLVAIPPEFSLRMAIWGEDSFIYYNTVPSGGKPGIWRIPVNGGKPELVLESKTSEKGITLFFPQQTLDGGLLYSTVSGPLTRSVEWIKLHDSAASRVVERGMGGRISASNHLLYSWMGALWAVPFDAAAHRMAGSPVEVAHGVTIDGFRGPRVSVSNTGTLAYMKPIDSRRTLVWIAPNQQETPLPLPAAAYEQAEVSPDGKKLAIVRQDDSSRWILGIHDLGTGAWTKLLETVVPRPRVLWSPDGQSVIASATFGQAEYVNLYRIPIASPQSPERLTESPNAGQFPLSWSAKAQALLYVEGVHPATQTDIMMLPLNGDRRPRTLVATPGVDRSPSFSPDGHAFLYSSEQKDRRQLAVQSLAPNSSSTPVANADGWDHPLWAGKRLYFIAPGGMLSETSITEEGVVGEPKTILATGKIALPQDWWTRPYSLAPDGRLLILRDATESGPRVSQIHVVVNWFQELKRLAPLP